MYRLYNDTRFEISRFQMGSKSLEVRMGSPALVCKCSGRLLRGLRFVVGVITETVWVKFAGISVTSIL